MRLECVLAMNWQRVNVLFYLILSSRATLQQLQVLIDLVSDTGFLLVMFYYILSL